MPADPEATPSAEALRAALGGMLADGGEPGPRAPELVTGGFARWRVDRPGAVALYANAQGGFRVTCPRTGENVVPVFDAARRAWRWAGGPRSMSCACGETHALEDLDYSPPAAFGRVALELADAQHHAVTPESLAKVEQAWGPVRVVGRRV